MAISNLRLVLWWQSFPEWSMVSHLDIMILSTSDTHRQLLFRSSSKLSFVMSFFCKVSDKIDTFSQIDPSSKTFVQVIAFLSYVVEVLWIVRFRIWLHLFPYMFIFLVIIFELKLYLKFLMLFCFFIAKVCDFGNLALDDVSFGLWMTGCKVSWLMMVFHSLYEDPSFSWVLLHFSFGDYHPCSLFLYAQFFLPLTIKTVWWALHLISISM